ncbi:MAG TPA: hypothetical protein PKD53_32775 [Chloroflexaceae bacterium]|nr:hypothetical protein [Chloroflexaceae bacterium]
MIIVWTLLVTLIVGPLSASARAAPSTPPETGCPAGWLHETVAWFEEQGPYRVPRAVDEAGNNNGSVCAHPYAEAARIAICGPDCPVPVVYQFRDDDLPAKR